MKARQSSARDSRAIRRTSGGCCKPRILFRKHLLKHRCVCHGAGWVAPSTSEVRIQDVRAVCRGVCVTAVVVRGFDPCLSSVFDIRLSLQV